MGLGTLPGESHKHTMSNQNGEEQLIGTSNHARLSLQLQPRSDQLAVHRLRYGYPIFSFFVPKVRGFESLSSTSFVTSFRIISLDLIFFPRAFKVSY